jgi:hypothetical protein
MSLPEVSGDAQTMLDDLQVRQMLLYRLMLSNDIYKWAAGTTVCLSMLCASGVVDRLQLPSAALTFVLDLQVELDKRGVSLPKSVMV